MKPNLSQGPSLEAPTRVRYGVLAFASSLSMITYLDRVCMGTVAPTIKAEFALTDEQLGLLFTAFALAYALFEVPSGWLGDVFGPRKTLIRIVLWWSVFTSLTGCIWKFTLDSGYRIPLPHWLAGDGGEIPLLINGFLLLLLVRFLFGMGEAGAYPNIARSFHNWFPFSERGFAQGAVWMAGRFAGGMTPLVVTCLLMVVHWRHTFWIFGSLGLAWCFFFWRWFCDRPEHKATVNRAELELIRGEEGAAEPAHAGVPWLKLLTNINLWLLCVMYFCGAYGWYFNITWLPKYLDDHYGVSAASSGSWMFSLQAGAPLLLGSLACLVGGLLTDAFIRRTGNRKWGRRIFGILGHGICAICYFLSMYATSAGVFVLAIALAAFWNDLTMGSAWASCLDIGGKYSGIVAGCMNTIGNLGGAAAGYITGKILVNYGAERGWRVNFFMFGAVYIVAVLCWLGFDSTKPVIVEPVRTGE